MRNGKEQANAEWKEFREATGQGVPPPSRKTRAVGEDCEARNVDRPRSALRLSLRLVEMVGDECGSVKRFLPSAVMAASLF